MPIDNIRAGNDAFPNKLMQLYDPPESIYAVGANLSELLSGKALGVVGSRKVSSYGRTVTSGLTKAAARAGLVIVSGLALGIDSIAHQSALDVGGKTIAVLPSGIEKIYPVSHTGLARNIIKRGGALVSEYTGKTPPMRHQFIERNRLIAALSDALLITEAAEKSGSLHTARFALELGRPVLAVPGNITNAGSVGTNNLIKMGAQPITNEQDLLDALGVEADNKPEQLELYGDNDFETVILSLIREGTSSGSELLDKSAMPVEDFQRHMTMLEIKGRIRALGNDHWALN